MANDNTLTVVATQTEGGKVLSRLTLEYPDMDNTNANLINLGLTQAMLDKVAEFADAKAAGLTIVPPGQAKK